LSFTTASPEPGQVGVRDGHIVVAEEALVAVDSIPLPGAAGLEDVMAAAGAALSYGVSANAVVRAIKGYRPLSHRLETVAEVGGVTFIDDSKATNPHATLMAVRGLDDVVLIAGGRSKGIDLSVLTDVVPPVRSVIALGEATVELVRIFSGIAEVFGVSTMEEAVQAARARAAPGGSVLLSPACASLDMYESYAQRGEHFARCVRASVQRTENDGNS
jgi:UDP-N-acetylmuramoylalanine--D-glutamate ligase